VTHWLIVIAVGAVAGGIVGALFAIAFHRYPRKRDHT
jgi:predicted membrane protein